MAEENDKAAPTADYGLPTSLEEVDAHKCGKCKKLFTDIGSFLQHKQDCIKTTKYTASQPTKDTFAIVNENERKLSHPENHVEVIVYSQSEPADEAFHRSSHPITTIAPGTHKCSECECSFSRVATLKAHMRQTHNTQIKGDITVERSDHHGYSVTGCASMVPMMSQGPKSHICNVCHLSFKSSSILRSHRAIHTNARPFPCTYKNCTFSFKTKGSLVRHTRRHTGSRPFTCSKCNRSFRESGALNRHLKSQRPCYDKTDADLPRYGKKLLLPGEVVVPTTGTFSDHEESVDIDQVNLFQCPVSTASEQEGAEQIRILNADDSCDVPNVVHTFSIEDDMPKTGDRKDLRSQCWVCDKAILDREELIAHIRTHLSSGHFHCEVCSFVGTSRKSLTAHTAQHHSLPSALTQYVAEHETSLDTDIVNKDTKIAVRDASKAMQQLLTLKKVDENVIAAEAVSKQLTTKMCPVCQKSFKANSYLRMHMRTHTGERPFKCRHCSKDFATKDTYSKHMLSHSDERQYKCGDCGKLFKRISHVKEHLKIHNNDKPYHCEICQKTFRTSNAFKVHSRTHSQMMPWLCKICPKRFREKGSLQRHIRTHTGEKPFACSHCGKLFAEHGTLNRHLRAKIPCTPSLAEERAISGGKLFRQCAADLPAVLTNSIPMISRTQLKHAEVSDGELCILDVGAGHELEEADSDDTGDQSRVPTYFVVHGDNIHIHLAGASEELKEDLPGSLDSRFVLLDNSEAYITQPMPLSYTSTTPDNGSSNVTAQGSSSDRHLVGDPNPDMEAVSYQ